MPHHIDRRGSFGFLQFPFVPRHVARAQPALTAYTAVTSVSCAGVNLFLLGIPSAESEQSHRLLSHSALPRVLRSAQTSKLGTMHEGKKTQSLSIDFEFVLRVDAAVAYLMCSTSLLQEVEDDVPLAQANVQALRSAG